MVPIKRTSIALLLLSGLALALHGQENLTPRDLFDQVASRYSALYDYSATIVVNTEDSANPGKTVTMTGQMWWKSKSRLRIDFSSPKEQVLVSTGEVLQVYLPQYNITLSQKLDTEANNPAGLATKEGLSLMRKGYTIAFKHGAAMVPMDEGKAEKVYKLLLTGNSRQGFRQIELSISENKYIRRIDGITADQRKVRLEFSGISINQGIPDNKFSYTPPPEANQYDSFLFGNNN